MSDTLPSLALPDLPGDLDGLVDAIGHAVRVAGDDDSRVVAVADSVDAARFLANYLNAYQDIAKELDRLRRAVALRDANIRELEAELARLRGGP